MDCAVNKISCFQVKFKSTNLSYKFYFVMICQQQDTFKRVDNHVLKHKTKSFWKAETYTEM